MTLSEQMAMDAYLSAYQSEEAPIGSSVSFSHGWFGSNENGAGEEALECCQQGEAQSSNAYLFMLKMMLMG